MGNKAKAIGLLLVISAIACFIQNFGIFHFWIIGGWSWFWNPIGYFVTPRLVGNIPIISGGLGWLVNGFCAIVYSAVLFIVGAFALFH